MSVNEEEGIIAVILQRFNHERLPRVLEMKKIVDAGGTLSDEDLSLLTKMQESSRDALPYIDRHPELHAIFGKAIALYAEVSNKALENESKAK